MDKYTTLQVISQLHPNNKLSYDRRLSLLNIHKSCFNVAIEWTPVHCIHGNGIADNLLSELL